MGINWLEWDKKAFEKAKKEKKPVLLDLTAVWCHWCHVMDATSYSDNEIIDAINKDFVPVKVYIDKRPDIRERYNMGGFPSTVFLDPDGRIIAGDTYVPAERLKLFLEAVKKGCKSGKASNEKAVKMEEGVKKETMKINESIIKDILLLIEDNFDSLYGGFGVQPKFPAPEALDLLFLQYQKTQNKKYLDMALKTLDGMHDGIFDKIDFGFFRYSATQDWKMPHYEKMLDTNAGLLRNYAVAYSITKNEKYKKIALETFDYVNKFLSDQEAGGFYGSQDADEEFYHLSHEERKNKKYPDVDRTIYVDWNAMMISSFIRAGAILNDNKAAEFAIKTADFIIERCCDKNGLWHFFDGKPNISGLLSDNVFFLNCLIDAHYMAQNEKYLGKICKIAEFILDNFYDEKYHGFFDRIPREGDLGELKSRNKHFLENSFCAIVFLRLCFLTKEDKYKKAAEDALIHFAGNYLDYGHFASMYAVAVDMLVSDEIKVDIVNRKDMLNLCLSSSNPRIVVNFMGKDDKKSGKGYEAEGAYVCRGNLCKGPIKDYEKLEQELIG